METSSELVAQEIMLPIMHPALLSECDSALVPGGPYMQRNSVYLPADYSELAAAGYATYERVCGLLALYAAGKMATSSEVLFSGGVQEPVNGRLPDRELPTEAAVLSDYFIKGLGVAMRSNPQMADRLRGHTITIHQDPTANSSHENVLVTRHMARQRDWRNTIAVTNMPHGGRLASFVAQSAGLAADHTFLVAEGEHLKTGVFGCMTEQFPELHQILYPHLSYSGGASRNTLIQQAIQTMNQQALAEQQGLHDLRRNTYRPRNGAPRVPDLSKIHSRIVLCDDLLADPQTDAA